MAVHRADCSNWRQMAGHHPERVIAVTWGQASGEKSDLYAVDIVVEGFDRSGLLRDVCDALAQGKAHVTAMQSQSQRDRVSITLTVQTADTNKLQSLLSKVMQVEGVHKARRK